jgi:hypothetical protein
MAVQAAAEQGQLQVHATQRLLGVVYRLAGDPHRQARVWNGTGLTRIQKV